MNPGNPEPAGAAAQSSGEYLRALIAEAGGTITLERFMQEALYHPRFGYYANQVRRIGAGGDFATSPTMHAALPRAIAAWASAHRREVSWRGAWHVIELGGGGGEMGAGFLSALGWFARLGVRYHVVEVSRPLRALQEKRLARLGRLRRRVRWHADMEEALAAADGRALIFSNEFVDAFPCVQLCRNGKEGDASSRRGEAAGTARLLGPLTDTSKSRGGVGAFLSEDTGNASRREGRERESGGEAAVGSEGCVRAANGGQGEHPAWSEIAVAWPAESAGPVERFVAWTPEASAESPQASVLGSAFESAAAVGQRVEIHRSYRRWLRGWAGRWTAGRMLTIDYGDVFPEVYHRRPQGTLRGYLRHERMEGAAIYERFGRQDLTADVNFTDLMAWGAAAGWRTAGYGSQCEFLRRWLTRRELASADDRDRALGFLLDEAGAGGAFKVLEQIAPGDGGS